MPIIDSRELRFDAAAFVIVLAHSRRMADAIGLPSILPGEVHFDPKAGSVQLDYASLAPRPGGHGSRISLPIGPLGALLIAYCLRAKIRIPRDAERSIRVDRDAVVLVFGWTHTVPAPFLGPERTKSGELSLSLAGMELPPVHGRNAR